MLLLIEDDERVARLLLRVFADEGFLVTHRATGADGICAAAGSAFDLVILDLMLPDLDGVMVLRRVLEAVPERPVLVLSAVPEIAVRVACLDNGAVDFVGKPFALEELVARVRARIRRSASAQSVDVLVAGPVRLNQRLHRVEVDGRGSTLSLREFVLLRHLMQRAGAVCSREELLQSVWGMAFDPGSNVVDVYVRRLRAKLDGPDRIATVRHVGYRFEPL